MFGFPAPRHHYIGAPEESDEDAAGHFEQRVSVGRRQRQGDKIAPRRGPRPHPDVADTRGLIEPGHEQFTREGPAHGFPTGWVRVKQHVARIRVRWVVTETGAHGQSRGVRPYEPQRGLDLDGRWTNGTHGRTPPGTAARLVNPAFPILR